MIDVEIVSHSDPKATAVIMKDLFNKGYRLESFVVGGPQRTRYVALMTKEI